jgi:NTP pyrophosphatase (non-canonical NTP hydrolase)
LLTALGCPTSQTTKQGASSSDLFVLFYLLVFLFKETVMAMTQEDYEKFKSGMPAIDIDGDYTTFLSEHFHNKKEAIIITCDDLILNVAPDYCRRNLTLIKSTSPQEPELSPFDLIRAWAEPKGLLDPSKVDKQMLKLGEEFGELCAALARDHDGEAFDAIGDMVVVLTILAKQKGWGIEAAIESAYEIIKNRTGKTVNGVFLKDSE